MRFNIWPLIESHRALSIFALVAAVASVTQCATGIVDFEKISLSKGKVAASPKVEITPTSVSNLLTCLGNTGDEQLDTKLSGCLNGVSLPNTTTADQILDILRTFPRDKMERRDALVMLLRNSKITISGGDATLLLKAFGADLKRYALFSISCHIKRPIEDSDKNDLLTGIDPMWQVRQELEKYPTPPCEK